MGRLSLTALAVLLLAIAGAASAPSVKDVMRRVAEYVETYGDRASILVATESATQETRSNASAGDGRRRTTVAEFAILKVASIGWVGFRDVIEVDGRALPDRGDRLVRSLTRGGGAAEARVLSDESARFNIGSVERNFNVPTTALFYFGPDNQRRFTFTAKSVNDDGTWRIAFREVQRPTLIRTPDGQSVRSEGEIWVRPSDGTVMRTVLTTNMTADERPRLTKGEGRIEVAYALVERLGMWLPATMTEQFEVRRPGGTWERVEGRAVYSNYRQFTTSGRIK